MLDPLDHNSPHRGVTFYIGVGLRVAMVLALAATLPTRADVQRPEWRMIGHDIANTRSQPFESRISARNVARLKQKWVLTTDGDVSATPAVVAAATMTGTTAMLPSTFPTGAASSGKSTPKRASFCGRDSISEYNGIPNSISRTSPRTRAG